MNGKHYIGDKAATFKSTGRTRGIDGVALVVDDGTEYKAGDQLGYVLVLECPYGTQAMADALLEKLRGKSYEGFETTGAALPSGAELGDGVTVKGLYAPIVRRRVQFVGDLAADVSAPTGGRHGPRVRVHGPGAAADPAGRRPVPELHRQEGR